VGCPVLSGLSRHDSLNLRPDPRRTGRPEAHLTAGVVELTIVADL
jgi:hypothetical protein